MRCLLCRLPLDRYSSMGPTIEDHRSIPGERVKVTDSGQMTCECTDADGAACQPLRADPLDNERGADLAAGFKALGDPHRVAILHLLAVTAEPVCVVDVERHIDLAQSTISHHLKTLLDAGIISRERRGKWSYYSIEDERLAELGVGIDRFARTVARTA